MIPWQKNVYEIGKEIYVNANFFISVDFKNISDVDFYYFNVGNNKKHTMYGILFSKDGKYNVLVESRHSRDKAHHEAISVDDNIEIIRAILKQDGEKLISLLKNEQKNKPAFAGFITYKKRGARAIPPIFRQNRRIQDV